MRNVSCGFAFLALVLTLSGCTPKTVENSIVPPVVPPGQTQNDQKISFLMNVNKGYSTKGIAYGEYNWGEAINPFVINMEYTSEVTDIEKNTFKWKTIYTVKTDRMGDHILPQGQGLPVNRIILSTNDQYGNLISSEGEEPDTPQEYNTFPEHPIEVGDSWKGYSMQGNARRENRFTLEAIRQVKNKKYAVISFEKEEKGGSSSGVKWVDLETLDEVKSEYRGTSTNKIGQSGRFVFKSYSVDENGDKIVPETI